MMSPEQQTENKIQMSRSELLWGVVVLYGIIMWTCGFVLAWVIL